MRLTRVFVDTALEADARVTLEGSAAAHVTRVLRLRKGDALTLFNGRGGEYAAVIEATGSAGVTVVVGAHARVERESPLQVTVAQGISRGERMDLVVQKATELGVHTIVPVLTERSVVRLDERQAHRKVQHWRAVAIGGCEQCGRNRVPHVTPPRPLREFIRDESGQPAGARLLLSPAAPPGRLDDLPRELGAITVLIGPEGGLTDEEQRAAVAAGYTAVGLGPRVLRTETAALVVLALLQQQFGDLGRAPG
jgi:16S rRNA (uracil1498-N3)-methyltransferase